MPRVLIMAGGRGLRLHPLTETRPKPLLPIGNKPILRTIVDGFVEQGFRDIWLSVRYKSELIKDYFGNGHKFGCCINYITEDEPLGTAGCLKLLPGEYQTVIVSNADILTKINYGDLFDNHYDSGCDATICVALHQQQIHYGVVDTEDGKFFGIREKPIENFYVNAGIYVINRKAIEESPWFGNVLMTDFLSTIPREKINIYPIEDFWLDIGRFEDLGKAIALAAE